MLATTPRDQIILADLWQFPVLTSSQVAALYFGASRGALGTARRRMSILADRGVVLKMNLALGGAGAPEVAVTRPRPTDVMRPGQRPLTPETLHREWARGEAFASAVGPQRMAADCRPEKAPFTAVDIAWRVPRRAGHDHVRWWVVWDAADLDDWVAEAPQLPEVASRPGCAEGCRRLYVVMIFPTVDYAFALDRTRQVLSGGIPLGAWDGPWEWVYRDPQAPMAPPSELFVRPWHPVRADLTQAAPVGRGP